MASKKLCFVYIEDYLCLKEVGLSFNSEYNYRVDKESKTINITPNENYIKGFWGKGVSELTAIIGNNGAGKSTSIRFLLGCLVSGVEADIDGLKGLVIWKENGKWCLWNNNMTVWGALINGKSIMPCHSPEFECFYYSSIFNPFSSSDNILSVEWTGFMNMSGGYLMTKDLQSYGNQLSGSGNYSYRDYLSAHYSMNQYRIADFLLEEYNNVDLEINVPRYIKIVPNRSGEWLIKHNPSKEYKEVKLPQNYIPNTITNAENRFDCIWIYHCFCNLIATYIVDKELQSALIDWTESLKYGNANVFAAFESYIEIHKAELKGAYDVLKNVVYVIGEVKKVTKFSSNSAVPFYYVDAKNDKGGFLQLINESWQDKTFVTPRYFDMIPAHEIERNGYLSSGEQELLNLYSRIYSALKHQIDEDRKIDLLVLDEAEVGLHPEWQRKYIYNIVKFLKDIAEDGHKYQVILTSHSPIILSDIPMMNVNMLKKEYNEDATKSISHEHKETFCSNIFELYKDSFFLSDGLMGKFAKEYLINIQKCLKNKEYNIEDIKKRISLIGDPRIKNYFTMKLGEIDNNAAIEMLNEQINKLRNK